jgi:hypothetical protein
MTHTITLNPEVEKVIERRAKRRGVTVTEYLQLIASSSARKREPTAASRVPKTPTETIQYWTDNHLINLFADGQDSPELAANLRRVALSRCPGS